MAEHYTFLTRRDSDAPFNIVPYTIAAFGTLLVYDYLCTFSEEVSLVWTQPWHLGTILFFMNRYPPFIDTFLSLFMLTTIQSPETCSRSIKTMTWLIVLGVFVAEAILMLRTYAIYERKRWVLIFLCVVLGSVSIPALIVVQLEMDSLHYGYPPDGIYKGCYLTDPTSAIIFIAYILVVLSETIIVSLTLVKAVQHLRRSSVPLVVNLYRNGILFYLYILAISLANVLVPVTVKDVTYDNWLATPQRILHSVFCNRILLSILRSRPSLAQSRHAARTTDRSSFYNFTSILPPSGAGSDSVATTTVLTPNDDLYSVGGIGIVTSSGRYDDVHGAEGDRYMDDADFGIEGSSFAMQDVSRKGKQRAVVVEAAVNEDG